MPPVDLKTIFNVDEDTARDAEDILRPFDELIPIIVEGNEIKLPNNNSLWRGMQFWGLMTGEISIDFGLYCIAGTCKNCKTRIRRAGEERKVNVLACQTTVEPGLEITRLAPGFKFIKKDY
ncbi:MAG: (2Fe-2S)-binding protein [Planctomycetes bacterium]|nr:(2Fe-2S)-binding protein [Planctomycetota bacterium]